LSKKESGSIKSLNKRIAKALTLTIAAATVVPLLPANFTTAQVSRDVHAVDAADISAQLPPVDAANPVNQEPEGEQTPVQEPTEEVEVPTESEDVVQPEVAALNPVQTAETVTELQNALAAVELALNLTGYQALSAEDQAQVAAVLLGSNSDEAFADSGAIQQALNKAVAAQRDIAALRDAIASVNSAESAEQLKSALEVPYLGLVLLNYRNLSDDAKLAAATAVLQAAPTGGFVNRTDIQKTFNTAIAGVLEAETQE
jgi:hypothetical protein